MQHKEHQAHLTFTNPFRMPISGELTVAGSGLLESKINIRLVIYIKEFTPPHHPVKVCLSKQTEQNPAKNISTEL